MERTQIDARSALLGAVGGACIGAGAGWLVCRRYLARRFDERLDAESAALKEHYRDRTILGATVQALGYAPGQQAAESLLAPDGKLGEEAGVAADEVDLSSGRAAVEEWVEARIRPVVDQELAAADNAQLEEPVSPSDVSTGVEAVIDPLIKDRDTSKPYVISFEEFLDMPEGYQQLTLTFYAADGVLCDTNDEPIPNYSVLTGEISPLHFGGISKDPHIRYVRNEEREIDFEIVLNAGSYAEVVLNYGSPAKERSTPSPRRTNPK